MSGILTWSKLRAMLCAATSTMAALPSMAVTARKRPEGSKATALAERLMRVSKAAEGVARSMTRTEHSSPATALRRRGGVVVMVLEGVPLPPQVAIYAHKLLVVAYRKRAYG